MAAKNVFHALNRRDFLKIGGVVTALAASGTSNVEAAEEPGDEGIGERRVSEVDR